MRNRIEPIGRSVAAALCLFALATFIPPIANQSTFATTDTEIAKSTALTFSPTNRQSITDIVRRPVTPLTVGRGQSNIAALIPMILERYHYSQAPLDASMSGKFLDRYVEMLDGMHFHFLETDMDEFEKYRATMGELVLKEGEVRPAHYIFSRFLERVTQRVDYVGELLVTEKFEFTGDDRYNLDRRKAPRPKDIAAAQHLWRQHLRYEILQEKLNKEKPEDIAKKITKRYSGLLRSLKEYDRDDVFELYLSALAQVYDPHTDYMGKSSLDTFNINMSLKLTGIGALLQSEDGYCRIKSLVPEGPASKSKKVKENDRIVAVAQGPAEPVDVIEMPLKKVVDMIRGPKDTEVRLTIIPADAPDPSVRSIVSLIRDEIKLTDQEAKAKIIDQPSESGKPVRLGVIDLPSFYADFDLNGQNSGSKEPKKSTTRDVKLLLQKLVNEHVDGVILDLRRNGGGSLEEAINLTGLFIKEGPVVQVKNHDQKVDVDKDTDSQVHYDGPLIVLTSRFSASASEILAGALQDYGRALVVGDKSTHGKGTVQQLIQLNKLGALPRVATNPGALKITIRNFYRVTGSSTQKKGVIPDVILPSPNNLAEVGEASLENALPWDTIAGTKFEPENRIQPHLTELQKRSSGRIESDPDFKYLREEIDQLKKSMDDRTVSLNEETRLKEKAEAEARSKARLAERKSRPQAAETVYDLTLALAAKDGLPAPASNPNAASKTEHPEDTAKAKGEDGENADEPKISPVDVAMKEAKRILADLISLGAGDQAIAATDPKNAASRKPPAGDVTGTARQGVIRQ